MSKKKGLSFEEKRTRLKQLFLETKQVFTLKELTKVASKEKGIVAQTVEEVLKSLLDDGEVMSDKIGTSNYYWCFPSQELVIRRNKAEAAKRERDAQEARLREAEAQHSELIRTRPETPQRKELLRKLAELQAKRDGLAAELVVFAENDPALIDAMVSDSTRARDAANRWTDNIFALRKWCGTKFMIEPSAFNQQFEIPEEMDYLEPPKQKKKQ